MRTRYLAGWMSALLLARLTVVGILGVQGCTEPPKKKPSTEYAPGKADLEFEKGADRPPTLRTLYTMADILAAQGKDVQAEAVLLRIIQEHPEFVPARNSLAELQMRQRRVNDAIETLSAGLGINRYDPVLLNNLGMCFMMQGQYERALEMFTSAAGIVPENARYRANMAVALGLLGRDQEALALYRQILPEEQAQHNIKVIQIAHSKAVKSSKTP